MILEIAELDIKDGQTAAFEESFQIAQQQCLQPATGYIKHSLVRCIESPNHYRILIYWATLENHTVDFRESEGFVQWRDIIGPFFSKPPSVAHYSIDELATK